jgi:hypothetical protein
MILGRKQFQPMFPSPDKVPKEVANAEFPIGFWCSACWIAEHRFLMTLISLRGEVVGVGFMGLDAVAGLLSPVLLNLAFFCLKNKQF